jgi:hypothetical protein
MRVIPLNPCGIEALGHAHLSVDIDHHSPIAVPLVNNRPVDTVWRGSRLLLHEVEGEFTGELDESVVSGFRDDEDVLNPRADSCAACIGQQLPGGM